MTEVIAFQPQPDAAFQFLATLDETSYLCIVTWNLFGQRWYLRILDDAQRLVLATALVGSPDDFDISLTQGYFATPLVFRAASQQFEIG